uniref:WLM domain-containing protein n=1 Tax=Rhizochromulina marina TaxID=1034831 RepID=A0A7S2W3W4_9STRA
MAEMDPFEADKLLRKMATDPGVVAIMRGHRFCVGTLAEMDPEDDRLQKQSSGGSAGGGGGACTLGYNQNAGQRIYIRLRNDSLRGFRPYRGLVNTLLHELAHNVVGPHNEHFWRLFGELRREYLTTHGQLQRQGEVIRGSAVGRLAELSTAETRDVDAGLEGELLQEVANGALRPEERLAAGRVAEEARQRRAQHQQLEESEDKGWPRKASRETLLAAVERRVQGGRAPPELASAPMDVEHPIEGAGEATLPAPPAPTEPITSGEQGTKAGASMRGEECPPPVPRPAAELAPPQTQKRPSQRPTPSRVPEEADGALPVPGAHTSTSAQEARGDHNAPSAVNPEQPALDPAVSLSADQGLWSRLEALAGSMSSLGQNDGVATLALIVTNLLAHPQDEKFRRLRIGNKRMSRTLGSSGPGIDFLREIGFSFSEPGLLEVARPDPAVLWLASQALGNVVGC